MTRSYLLVSLLCCSFLILGCGESSKDPDDFYGFSGEGGSIAGSGGSTGGSGGSGGSTGGTGGSGGETDAGEERDGGGESGADAGGSGGQGGSAGSGGDSSVDECPDDPDKTEPGVCGCGTPDDDTDGDGTMDCEDECPKDEDFTTAPDCGCPSHPEKRGAKCGDGFCAAAEECDGAGNCGTPADCPPDPDCTHAAHSGHDYWFCPDGTMEATWDAADTACAAVGLYLVKIDDPSENSFINTNRTEQVWIGLKDLAGDNQWKWKVDGKAPSYTNWNPGEPSNTYEGSDQDCAFMGYAHTASWDVKKWTDGRCSEKKGYVCEADW